ncbi:hypothetical protein HRJ45_12125 [Vibrio coralliilyticus]|uniref:hypothetical protein n=1 Tax=Vibrio coralliilyticus TaxID=190893 RepID=UPI00155F82A2|nr:hypothetical protein [Vibrio coralliilyticus]NRF25515.1 hypothetical protein [Vibrio coralliilyticus]NRF79858.1 hypothetical protein [Vibrio coralliilyticus]
MKRFIAFVGLILSLSSAHASGVPSGTQYNGEFSIKSILVDGNASLRYFTVDRKISFCSKDIDTFWLDNSYVSESGNKSLLSTLMLAKSANLKIEVYFTTADDYCRATMIKVL